MWEGGSFREYDYTNEVMVRAWVLTGSNAVLERESNLIVRK